MLTLHYFSNATISKTESWNEEENEVPVYSKDLIKEFETYNPTLENELGWILSTGKKISFIITVYLDSEKILNLYQTY